mmetsp:Transcript_34337/g.94891  ORF Transcript_34337/g.94891 Transcript_34337/m.94891 type:complete len:329 (-) Transcript_34337:63-1049(-)
MMSNKTLACTRAAATIAERISSFTATAPIPPQAGLSSLFVASSMAVCQWPLTLAMERRFSGSRVKSHWRPSLHSNRASWRSSSSEANSKRLIRAVSSALTFSTSWSNATELSLTASAMSRPILSMRGSPRSRKEFRVASFWASVNRTMSSSRATCGACCWSCALTFRRLAPTRLVTMAACCGPRVLRPRRMMLWAASSCTSGKSRRLRAGQVGLSRYEHVPHSWTEPLGDHQESDSAWPNHKYKRAAQPQTSESPAPEVVNVWNRRRCRNSRSFDLTDGMAGKSGSSMFSSDPLAVASSMSSISVSSMPHATPATFLEEEPAESIAAS